jgi:hypothetical protein
VITVRPMNAGDESWLKARAEASGHPYPDFGPNLEAVLIAEGQDGIVMACAAERIVQLYLWAGDHSPMQKLAALRALHAEMAEVLKAKGYSEANAFIPPCLAVQFGKRLERTFSWLKNWDSWYRRF